jgi:predicted cupin superfamily sugar epimerase
VFLSVMAPGDDGRHRSFVLEAGDIVPFHHLRGCAETWTLAEGGPVELHLIHADGRHEVRILATEHGAEGHASASVEAGSLRAVRLAPSGRTARLCRAVRSGQRPSGVDVPQAGAILRRHPLHHAIVIAMTAG